MPMRVLVEMQTRESINPPSPSRRHLTTSIIVEPELTTQNSKNYDPPTLLNSTLSLRPTHRTSLHSGNNIRKTSIRSKRPILRNCLRSANNMDRKLQYS